MSKLNILLTELRSLETQIFDTEELLKNLKDRKRFLLEDLLVNEMDTLGVVSTELADGTRLHVDNNVVVHVKAEDQNRICNLLRENGDGAVVKSVVEVEIPKGDENKFRELINLLSSNKYIFEEINRVHTGTLRKLLRTKQEAGESVNLEEFGARIIRSVSVRN